MNEKESYYGWKGKVLWINVVGSRVHTQSLGFQDKMQP